MTDTEHETLQELKTQTQAIFTILRGDDKGQLGLIQQVRFMWKTFWLWPLCTLSAIGGAIGTMILQRLFH